jgi:ABC-type polysaccharide transport system permease subunit
MFYHDPKNKVNMDKSTVGTFSTLYVSIGALYAVFVVASVILTLIYVDQVKSNQVDVTIQDVVYVAHWIELVLIILSVITVFFRVQRQQEKQKD